MPRQKVSKQALQYLKGVKRELAASIGAQAGVRTARSTYAKFKAMPLRFRSGKKNYLKNKRMVKMNPMAERKLSALTSLDEAQPVPIAAAAQAYKYTMVLGNSSPSTWSGFNAVGGFNFPQGTGNNERDGRYMWLDKTTMNMSIHMNPDERLSAPVQFRVIVFRARRVTTPTGVSYDPNLRLFLKPNGDGFGAGTSGIRFSDLYLQPTNKRDWIIVKDMKFTLSPFLGDGTTATAAWQGKYPNQRTMRVNLNHAIKSSFGTNEPDDFDYHYGVAIYAGRVGRDQIATGWEVNLRGTTSALDN